MTTLLRVLRGLVVASLLVAPSALASEFDAHRLLNRASQELARYELEAARSTLGEVVRLDPHDLLARTRLAELHAIGFGRGLETVAAWQSAASAHPDEPVREVWVQLAVVASHSGGPVTASMPWVRQVTRRLSELVRSEDDEARYAAGMALRSLYLRLRDSEAATEAGRVAAAVFPRRLPSRVVRLLEARGDGDVRAFGRECRGILRTAPGAVEACATAFSGSTWNDQRGLERLRKSILVEVARLAQRVEGDPVLAHEVARFYARPGVPPELLDSWLTRVTSQHSDFTLAQASPWWLGRPPPIATVQRRVRSAMDAGRELEARVFDAPWVAEARARATEDPDAALVEVRAARRALADLPYEPGASRDAGSYDAWTRARLRDVGRLGALEAELLQRLGRHDEAWPLLQEAAWAADDADVWRGLAEAAAARGESSRALEADLEVFARLPGRGVASLPEAYREAAVARFLAAHPAVESGLGWASLLSAAAARRDARGAGSAGTVPSPRSRSPIGPAPPLTGREVDGSDFGLKSLGGKVVVIDFWATWCEPCIAVMPQFEALRSRFDDRVEIIAASVDASWAPFRAFVGGTDTELRYVHISDADVWASWGVRAIPTTFVVDAEGNVESVHRGADPNLADSVAASVERLLAK